MLSRVLTIAAQEIRIGIRNRWILLATLILAVFSLALALLGSAPAGSLGVDRLTITVASLASLSVYLVPLIALLLAFDAICGEIERGTLLMTFSCPISRPEFLLGKAIGHTLVLTFALVIGYGMTAALLVSTGTGSLAGLADFSRLIATSVLLGVCFLAIGYVLSSLTRQSGTAAAAAIAAWLVLVVLYDLALLGALVANPSGIFASQVFPYAVLLNPADAFRLFNLAALGASDLVGGMAGVSEALPFDPVLALASLVLFAGMALTASAVLIRRITP
ncbi:ABC transporter permease [Roseibium album]|uniref:ABC-type transport system involved in multi-copper enzyme maturation, permease component n=1 Tax=Roseibium album TaxID=311410 RepID=A0A0M7B070_9HYPH|nr:ABC transporter permease subunit [Roseibium album]CTQ63348.1 ABC-type transport system involved in multi-copper enzyme maturation, permease component [Roseibium album]CTQ69774.1 ABC-type transport system involved in multi-copper enzyme maturation, permease component [Roseibium album]CTQ80935.1 ABC-type transport system involved in multi-copper enzyme maturation, permease component [Roseibium album]